MLWSNIYVDTWNHVNVKVCSNVRYHIYSNFWSVGHIGTYDGAHHEFELILVYACSRIAS